ncbi:MAG: hypothetical protein ACYTHK_14450 [Planctomycetota bacterium]|jgi:hypothetical protein
MPSDRILELLARPAAVFESALAATAEQVRTASAPTPDNGDPGFGAFAAGRMDTDRFASLLVKSETLDDAAVDHIREAHTTLTSLLERRKTLFIVDVPPGESLRENVARALAEIGRAFGAARTVDLARANGWRPEHEAYLHGFEFRLWNRTERESAPPLVVHVDGADLFAGGLLEFLDGALKIVLVVRGTAPPAPLAPLVRPGTFVLQTHDEKELARLAECEGPGVAALMPEGAARFVNDPKGGLTVDFLPDPPRKPVGGYSVAQQRTDLDSLKAPEVPVPVERPAEDPVDQLAAWLLDHAESE